MARTDNDTWDITEGVGATALGVAAGRAAENEREDRLFDDPYAQLFIDAAGEGMWTMLSRGILPQELAEIDPHLPARMQATDRVFRRVLPAGGRSRRAPSGDPGGRLGRPLLAAGVAAGNHRL